MSHTWMSDVTHMSEVRASDFKVGNEELELRASFFFSHVQLENESCHVYEHVMSHILVMSHI